MVVRIEAGVHGNECRGRTAVGKHADENKIRVVDPFERGIRSSVETSVSEERDAFFGRREVRIEFVVDVF